VENLDIDGNKDNQAAGDETRIGVYVVDSKDVQIRGCRIHDTGHAGVYTRQGCSGINISGNTFNGCGQESGNTYPCVYITGIDGESKSIRVTGNHFENSLLGVTLRSGGGTSGNDIVLFGHVVEGNTFIDIAQVLTFGHVEEFAFTNNTIINDAATRAPAASAISSQGYTDRALIANNAIYWNTTGQSVIEAVNAAKRTTISGNVIRGGAFGINVGGSGTDFTKIIGNTVQDTNSVGIFAQDSAAHVQFIGNTLVNTLGGTKCWMQVTGSINEVIVTGNNLYSSAASGTAITFDDTIDNLTFGLNRVSGFAANDNAASVVPSAELTMLDSNISLVGSITAGSLIVGGAKCLGYTSSTAAPSTTEYPADKNWGIHKDTNAGTVYLAYNDGGSTIKSVTLT
jgi:parallel beta-helix repeat protein